MNLEEFKAKVLEALMTTYATHKSKEYLEECLEDDYFEPELRSGLNQANSGHPDWGIRYAAENISMCI